MRRRWSCARDRPAVDALDLDLGLEGGHLAAEGVAAHPHVQHAQQVLGRPLDLAGQEDHAGAGAEGGQAAPDPLTSVTWRSWVELNPRTAADLGVRPMMRRTSSDTFPIRAKLSISASLTFAAEHSVLREGSDAHDADGRLAIDIRNGKNTVGDFVLINAMMIQLYQPLNFMGMVYREIKQAVIAGLGIALISQHTVTEELRSGRLIALRGIGLPIQRSWYLLRRADRQPSPATARISEEILTMRGAFLPQL